MAKTHRKGTAKPKGESSKRERTCIVERQIKPSSQLLRFVLDPDGNVVADLKNVLPGRGVWITAKKDYIETAVAKGLFARSFKTSAKADSRLADTVEELLETQARQALSLSSKAGLVTTGFEKVQACLSKRDLIALLLASDGAADGIKKMVSKLKKNGRTDSVSVHQSLRCEEMSLALGRVNVIHAALFEGGATRLFLKHLAYLDQFRGHAADDTQSSRVI